MKAQLALIRFAWKSHSVSIYELDWYNKKRVSRPGTHPTRREILSKYRHSIWPKTDHILHLWPQHILLTPSKPSFTMGVGIRATSHMSHEPWPPCNCESPKERVCPKAVPTHLPNHAVWSRALKCSVKPYVTGPSTKLYFNAFLFMRVLINDTIE